ncbi:MAG: hypothetical protein K9M49_10070 [Candidatus Marinimicrobia bacterium]|nr:hypothetical protein [Candidatus Neomarinimicrobiota bacterium]MCF7851230.1 hypothetical protein [Candidatus Neomarinimicrobiota bacterium]MCF7905480.1 hypothetical protein [Candidatus Neomarinimicrobiota bacterium]
MTRLYQKFRRIAKSISPLEISSDFSQEDLGWDDILFGGGSSNTSSLFLGKYSKSGIELFIDKFGLGRQVRQLGITSWTVDVNTNDPYKHILTVYRGGKKDREAIIMELIARYQSLESKKEDSDFIYSQPLRVLMIEWLLLQNPESDFNNNRPRLPGQQHPGIGLGEELLALFSLMGRHLKVDGILNVPQYLHTALFFSKRHLFLSPYAQALLLKLSSDLLSKYPLWKVAWASATGSIFNRETSEYYQWEPRKQLLPLNRHLKAYFKSEAYQNIARGIKEEKIYTIDEERMLEALRKIEHPPIAI